MIREQPIWSYSSLDAAPTTLLENRVIGIGLCLDRANGQCLWQKSFSGANTIIGESNGVIVATELITYTATFFSGCYGFDLETGKLLWTSHGNGLWGVLCRIGDFIPCFVNDMSDRPICLEDGRVIMESGRILDVRTGKQVERIPRKKAATFYRQLESPLRELLEKRKLLLDDGTWLTHVLPEIGQQIQDIPTPRSFAWNDFFKHGFDLYRLTESGDRIWSFQPEKIGCHQIHGYKLDLPYHVYLLFSEEKTTLYDSETQEFRHNLSRIHFVTISIETGKIIQNFLIEETALAGGSIQSVDAYGVLVSSNETHLWDKNRLPNVFRYFEKINPTA